MRSTLWDIILDLYKSSVPCCNVNSPAVTRWFCSGLALAHAMLFQGAKPDAFSPFPFSDMVGEWNLPAFPVLNAPPQLPPSD
jgi:hypothetical protein